MSQQQAPRSESVLEAERNRKAHRNRKKDLTAADFQVDETLRVRLKFSDGRELYVPATVVDAVYAKVDGRLFDHVVVRVGTPSEAFVRDLQMIEAIEGHLFLLDYTRSNYWFWRINTVQWVPE